MGDTLLCEAEFHGRRARDVELPLPPIGTRIVDAHDRRAAIFRIANEQDRAIGVNRTGRTVCFGRAKRLAGRG